MDKKIVSKDGHFIYLQDKQFWVSEEKSASFSSPAYYKNGACTAYNQLGLGTEYNKYYVVNLKLLRFSERFNIRKLRLVRQSVVEVKYGKKLFTEYGYISSDKFESLMKKRKIKTLRVHKVLCLKYTDAKWRDE